MHWSVDFVSSSGKLWWLPLAPGVRLVSEWSCGCWQCLAPGERKPGYPGRTPMQVPFNVLAIILPAFLSTAGTSKLYQQHQPRNQMTTYFLICTDQIQVKQYEADHDLS